MNYEEIREMENDLDREIEEFGKEAYICNRFKELLGLLEKFNADDIKAYALVQQNMYDNEDEYRDHIEMELEIQCMVHCLPGNVLNTLLNQIGVEYKELDVLDNPVCWLYDLLVAIGCKRITFFNRLKKLSNEYVDLWLYFSREPYLEAIENMLADLTAY